MPLWQLWLESEIATERLDHQHATAALLTQQAVAALFDKEAGKAFKEIIEDMAHGAE